MLIHTQGVTMPTMPGGCVRNSKIVWLQRICSDPRSGRLVIGVSFTSSAQINLNPGVYYVNGGNFNVGGAVVMNGLAGVTIVLTGSATDGYSPAYANVTIGNGAQVNLTDAEHRPT